MDNEDKIYYVYEHIRLDNMTTFYIGKGKGKRAYDNNRNKYHDRVASKCDYIVVIVQDNLSNEEAYWMERDLIEEYVFELGYGIAIKGFDTKSEVGNLTNESWGGIGCNGFVMSEESKKKISMSQIGKIASEEAKQKMSIWRKGIVYSKETIKKMSMSQKKRTNTEEFKSFISNVNKGRVPSEETREKISNGNKGKIRSDEFKRNLSESRKAENLSDETRKKYSEWQKGKNNNQSKSVICLTTNKIFDTIISASKFYNVKRDYIKDYCNNKRKSAGKLEDGTQLVWVFYKNK